MAGTIAKGVVPATIGPAELASSHAYVDDMELKGDEDRYVGMRVAIRDDAGALFAATVTGYRDHRGS